MLALVTAAEEDLSVSTLELDHPDHPYSIETLTRLKIELPGEDIFFVIGADSWQEITTWHRWEEVLTIVNIIVVTRPGFEITSNHVTEKIEARVVDLRSQQTGDRRQESEAGRRGDSSDETRIFITDAVNIDISATEIRKLIREGREGWKELVPEAVAGHIEKYHLYR
jgi:nicotinate-nucleotide adenylyltransferase